MKQLLTLTLLAGLALPATAQNRAATAHPAAMNHLPKTAAKATASNLIVLPGTLMDTSCHTSLYTASEGGYLAGVNGYGDQEKMMRYSLTTSGGMMPATVDTVMAAFGAKYLSGDGNISAKVYAADGTDAPGALLGTSQPVAVSAVDTTGGLTKFVFTTPVSLTTDMFFVSIDMSNLYVTGDTVGIYSSDECASVDPSASWDKFEDGSFMMVSDAGNWGINIEYYILATVTSNTGTGIHNIAAGTLHAQVYPNPANDLLKVSFDGKANAAATVALKDVTGRVVRVRQINATAGANEVALSVAGLNAGVYFCEIQQNGVRDVVKVMVK